MKVYQAFEWYSPNAGEKIKTARIAQGWSERAFAGELGISQRLLRYYEEEKRAIPLERLNAIADLLNVDFDLIALDDAAD